MTDANDSVRWLTNEEQLNWRSYLRGNRLLMEALDEALDGHALRLTEYEILSMLSEQPGQRARMSVLAELVVQSRSRLTHTAARLGQRGLVDRVSCLDDRRGVELVLTKEGLDLMKSLAAVHVASVREHFIDIVEPEEFQVVGRVMNKVLTALEGPLEDVPVAQDVSANHVVDRSGTHG